MARPRWTLLVVLMVASFGVAMVGTAGAQVNVPTTDNSLHPVGASDTQVGLNTGWMGNWGMGQFGSFTLHSWGRAPVRSGFGRTSVAVLRERHGLLR